ncbi:MULTISPECIES: hypothetical protein [unclassified Bradyrhizobium]|uniref:hypothetical protein n=1 Tax=unclassified Bradyrhizobium TaxID=2631580 RepID=UPI001CD703F5|nr:MULTISPECIES: hypothetical protein [unclassified Bradyrhizobium]
MSDEEYDYPGRIAEIEIDNSAAVCIEQIDDEITVVIAKHCGPSFPGDGGASA